MKETDMHESHPDRGAKLPDFLETYKHENPFVVPHNYFSELPDKVLDRIKEEKHASLFQRLKDIYRRWALSGILRPALAVASVLLIISVFLLWPNSTDQIAMSQLTQDEVRDYVINNIDEFEEEFFYIEEANDLDLLSESLEGDGLEELLDDLLDDIDEETIQNIL